MNLSEFLHAVAKAQGVDDENQALKLILADGNLTKVDIPAEMEPITEYDFKNLLSIDSAKNHPDIKRHFVATLLNGVEKDIDRYAKDVWELSDEDRAELKKIEGAQKRMEAAFKLGKDRLEKKSPPTDNEKVKKLETTISDLNSKLLAKEEETVLKLNEQKQAYLDKQKEHAFTELFRSFKYTDAIPTEVQEQTARAIFQSRLQQDNNKVIFKEDGSLQLLTNEDTQFYQNMKPVNLKQYVESVLAEKKVLQVTAPIKEGDGKKREPMLIVNPLTPGKGDNSSFQRELEASLQDLGSQA